ncbi:type II toxin-antitoxin system Phd/YefM family antitoxin [Paraoerskovia marina]|uniref:Antitoxin n=1 Tax=Paraoerskovia marina TaxID=545619 RepID=A0A1H1PSN8_9CELL|nr:type II toxin-antitoxin system prevent-host-death family antitoxin [Paraoerskovia marina]SDS14103.1 prevent-host-death family protein [Paraoerskovia marina]
MDVAVSALRAELKQWIERARDGEDVVITDRGVPVARLSGIGSADLVAQLIRDGVLTAPDAPRAEVRAPERTARTSGVTSFVRRIRR